MQRGLTEIVFLLDRSGSMAGLESDTIGGFNRFVRKQCDQEGETLLTTVLFDDQYEILWYGVDATKVILTHEEYYVRGMTALLDAVGHTVVSVGNRLTDTIDHRKPEKVIVVITTDGMENASIEYTHEKVKELIEQQRDVYNWDFIFMGANINASKEAESIGITEENAYQFKASEIGVENMYMQACKAVSEKR